MDFAGICQHSRRFRFKWPSIETVISSALFSQSYILRHSFRTVQMTLTVDVQTIQLRYPFNRSEYELNSSCCLCL